MAKWQNPGGAFVNETSETVTRVFVSYSRRDMEAADEIVQGLEFAGFAVTIDRNSITEGEDWRRRLGALIADADNIVFLLSPDSAASDICRWEVAHAEQLSKRLVPALLRPLTGVEAPPALAALNYVRFDAEEDGRPRSFMGAMRGLVRALTTDLEWVKEHTRFLTRSMEWDAAQRPESRLLLGDDVSAAKAWINARPKDAPAITPLQSDFLRASEEAELQRQSVEQRRLEEISRLQGEHADALKRREEDTAILASQVEAEQQRARRMTRRSFALLGGGIAVGGAAAYFSAEAVRWRREFEDAEADRLRDATREDITGDLVAFSTSEGQHALDGEGANSPYTKAVIANLQDRKTSVSQALLRANRQILLDTKFQQRPQFVTNLSGEVFMHDMPETRHVAALCIGVADYENLPNAPNAVSDARLWGATIGNAGLTPVLLENPTKGEIEEALSSTFEIVSVDPAFPVRKVAIQRTGPEPNSLAIVVFSGNGVVIDGQTYLLAADAKVETAKEIVEASLSLSRVKLWLSRFAATIIILDTSRSAPFAESPSIGDSDER